MPGNPCSPTYRFRNALARIASNMLPNVMSGLSVAKAWLMMGRGHVSGTRGDRAAGAGPAAADQLAAVLASAHDADVTHCVRSRRPRLRPGPDRLGAHRDPAAGGQPAAVRCPAGR